MVFVSLHPLTACVCANQGSAVEFHFQFPPIQKLTSLASSPTFQT
uniref:Uncharacterized protein n=1 Tax=Setaria viridis TaxID=4556 RepID=A0A4U6SY61_SETVI|nr:hypothetical protein SEVIR_9G266150v2 [Setaria viridis]